MADEVQTETKAKDDKSLTPAFEWIVWSAFIAQNLVLDLSTSFFMVESQSKIKKTFTKKREQIHNSISFRQGTLTERLLHNKHS